jgi:broad specificity phosphatase PhoE
MTEKTNSARKVRIYIVRHGESEANLAEVMAGHSNFPLTDKGREQARLTAEALRDVRFDGIYSSDLVRAVETANAHAELRGLSPDFVRQDKGLRELFVGDWECMSFTELEAKYGEFYTVTWKRGFGSFAAPGGESVPDLAERVSSTIAKIALATGGENILVASHGGAIRAFWGKIAGMTDDEVSTSLPFPSNASYSVVDFDTESGIFTPVEFSVDDHLADLKTFFNG